MVLDYQALVEEAMLGVVKKTLTQMQNNGFIGEQGFYISFRTDFNGVLISETVKHRYPKEITIILQHQFKNLRVMEDKFKVNIIFSGVAEDIEVPFHAIINFSDPAANFSIQFNERKNPLVYKKDAFALQKLTPPSESRHLRGPEGTNQEAKVVAIDKFRKKREEQDKLV